MFYWLLKRIVVGPVVRTLYRPRVTGVENIPLDGPAIIAPNHLSFCDSVFLPLAAPRQVHYVAKEEYFTGRGVKGRLMASFFRGVGAVPVDRSGGRASTAAIDTGMRELAAGRLFGIYPEGTRSPDGRLHRGRTGVAHLALASGAPVIPVGLVATDEVQANGSMRWRRPFRARPEIHFGKPLTFDRYEGMQRDRFVLRAVTDEIVSAILDLSGQEYVDMYATKAKLLAAKAAKSETELKKAA
ncbi:lysophospholipid acyltransferase family protein [Streptacidiphilus sp. MAP5-3]|uniref:lysophospholipid acyltransferase family protein n=2 Tax=Streptacidiphilus TaxID=228398 RepID=UPI003518D684